MSQWVRDLVARGPVITDGAWGTELQARGLGVGDFPDAWNLSHPERVAEVASAYVAAGSQVILTNTFGANRCRLGGHGLAGQVEEINRAGVRLSQQAAAGRARVFASMGPTGKMLVAGDTTVEELKAAFEEQARALADAGAEAIVVETMADLAEATAAVEAAQATGLPVVACMVFDTGKNRDRTMMGVTPEQAARALAQAGAAVVGANCGQGVSGYIPVCQRMRSACDLPIWIKPNAGLPAIIDDRAVYQITAGEFASQVPALLRAGASFVGGCCGTTPEFIRALRTAVLAL